jgi:regulatory associated protein of mTOR
MQQAEADEPGSIQYNHQIWRQQRNDLAINEVETQKYVARELCQILL